MLLVRLLRFGRVICSHELDQILTGQVGDMSNLAVTQVRARSITGILASNSKPGNNPTVVILADGGRGGLGNSRNGCSAGL